MSPHLLHERLFVSAAFFTFVMGIWGFWRFIRNEGIDGSYLGAIIIGEALLVVEALLGLWMYFAEGLRPGRWVHLLYGSLAVLIWPFVFTYTRESKDRLESLLFSMASFFLWGLIMRAQDTAQLSAAISAALQQLSP